MLYTKTNSCKILKCNIWTVRTPLRHTKYLKSKMNIKKVSNTMWPIKWSKFMYGMKLKTNLKIQLDSSTLGMLHNWTRNSREKDTISSTSSKSFKLHWNIERKKRKNIRIMWALFETWNVFIISIQFYDMFVYLPFQCWVLPWGLFCEYLKHKRIQ